MKRDMVDKSIIYSSNDLQNFLISLFAKPRVGACLMDSGAIFQSLAQSLLKLILAAPVLASSFQILIALVLMTLSVTDLFGLFGLSFKGYCSMFRHFQALIDIQCIKGS